MVTCYADGCDQEVRARGLCGKHYYRLQTYGDPNFKVVERNYSRREGCSVEDCPKSHYARGWCRKHYVRWLKHGDPNVVEKGGNPDPPTGTDNPLWNDEAGYHAIHNRMRRAKGLASTHSCENCGEPAAHWAYTHEDPDERLDPIVGCYYSPNPDFYVPLCHSCHVRTDRQYAKDRRVTPDIAG